MKTLQAQLQPKYSNVAANNSHDTLLTTIIDMHDDDEEASETHGESPQPRHRWPVLATAGGIALSIFLWFYGRRAIGMSDVNTPASNTITGSISDILPANLSAPAYQEKFALSEMESTYSFAPDDLNRVLDVHEDVTSDNTGHDFISNAKLEEDSRLIDAIGMEDLGIDSNQENVHFPVSRTKRNTAVMINRKIESVIKDHIFSVKCRQFMQSIWSKSKNNIHVKYAADDQKELMRLLAAIEMNIQFLQGKTKHGLPDISDDDAFRILHRFWDLTKKIKSRDDLNLVEQFKTDQLLEKWSFHKPHAGIALSDEDLYLQSLWPSWHEHDIRSNDTVIFHVHDQVRHYSLERLLNQQHGVYRGYITISRHFLFDKTGLPDTELEKYASSDHAQDFSEFIKSKTYFAQKAKNMFDVALENLGTTPLYFQRHTLIQTILDAATRASSPANDNQPGVINELIRLALIAPHENTNDGIANALSSYIHTLLLAAGTKAFGDLDLPRIGQSDIIFSSTDQFEKIHYDTATFAEIIGRNTKTTSISQHNNLRIHWPEEIVNNKEFMKLIGDIEKKASEFTRFFELESQIKKKREDLKKEIPSLESHLNEHLQKLCRDLGIATCDLSDPIDLVYLQPSSTIHMLGEKGMHFLQAFSPLIVLSPDDLENIIEELTNNADKTKDQKHTFTKTFTYGEILKGKHRKWQTDNHIKKHLSTYIRSDELSNEKKHSFIKGLLNYDAQEKINAELKKIKNNKKIKQHFDEFQGLLQAQLQTDGLQIYEFDMTPLLAMFVAPHASGNARKSAQKSFISQPVTLLSRVNGQIMHFKSMASMMIHRQSDNTFSAFLKAHFPADVKDPENFDDIHAHPISKKQQSNLFERTMDWHIKNLDITVRSAEENYIDEIAESLIDDALILTLPALMMNPATALLYTSIVLIGPMLLELENSDTRQEHEKLLSEVVSAVALQVSLVAGGELISQAGKFALQGVRNSFASTTREISFMRNVEEYSDSSFMELEQDFTLNCPSRVKREDDLIKCTVSNIASNRKAPATANSNWASRFNIIKKLFPDIKKIIAVDAKKIAQEKLKIVQDIIASGKYEEEVELAAQAYFGEKYDSLKFGEKIRKLQNGFEKLTMEKVNLSAPFRSESETVAQLNENAFIQNGKFIEVNKGKFKTYYKHVGKSDTSVADMVLHEMTHATIGTLDFAYIGSRNFRNGQVDVFELINLGNGNLETSLNEAGTSQRYVSPYGGAHLGNLRGSSADFGKTAGLQNADSVTQFISLLSKAKMNPEEFRREMAQLKSLREKTNGFTERIFESVLLNRSKRESKLANASGGEHFSPYIITFDQADNTINVYMLSEKPTDTIPTSDLPYRAAEYTNGRQKWEEEQRKQQEEKNREPQRRSNPPSIITPQFSGRSALGLAPGSSRNE